MSFWGWNLIPYDLEGLGDVAVCHAAKLFQIAGIVWPTQGREEAQLQATLLLQSLTEDPNVSSEELEKLKTLSNALLTNVLFTGRYAGEEYEAISEELGSSELTADEIRAKVAEVKKRLS